MKTLITGGAGFIGFHTARRLFEAGDGIAIIDNLNAYYDPALKHARLAELERSGKYAMYRVDIGEREELAGIFAREKPDRVVHMAAQAGVRYSMENPHIYADTNLTGFLNVMDQSRRSGVKTFIYASSASVYGGTDRYPFSESDPVDKPLSLYGATKRAAELMAHAYWEMFKFPSMGLRFFNAFGPWGRPDMALWKFTEAVMADKPLTVYGDGLIERDFTYIDDIVDGIAAALASGAAREGCPVLNIGKGSPDRLADMVAHIETALGKKARVIDAPRPSTDIERTRADISLAGKTLGYKPKVALAEGVRRFVEWYVEYRKHK
jgi:UDP-glucuronate 4-epimerase